jgi:putative transposase
MLNSFLLAIRFLILVFSGHKHVALENIALRHQLAVFTREKKRLRLRDRDRLFWIALKKVWKDWRSALEFVQPETVIGWQRQRFKRYWRRLSQPRRSGRPRLTLEIRKLIQTMVAANPIWGAPRIHGELLKLGFEISERTVSRLMPKDRKPNQTWLTFLRNHVGQLVSIDFFTVATIRLRVLYVFIVLAHDRRRVIHFNITEHPTAVWAAQQIIEAFPDDRAPRFMVRDRDGIYGESFRSRVEGMNIEEIRIAPKSPWQNCYVERVIGSIRRECINHVIVLNDNHLRRLLKDYFRYYHESRTHLSLNKDAPECRVIQSNKADRIVQIPQVGGLHHRYERRAA